MSTSLSPSFSEWNRTSSVTTPSRSLVLRVWALSGVEDRTGTSNTGSSAACADAKPAATSNTHAVNHLVMANLSAIAGRLLNKYNKPKRHYYRVSGQF